MNDALAAYPLPPRAPFEQADLALPSSDARALLDGAAVPSLPPASVHVWAWSLAHDDRTLDRARALLDDVERARAARFVHRERRDRFTLAHGVLRALLGSYARVAPGTLRFSRRAAGKPTLDAARIAFNLSHSADRAVLAVSRDEVGIDVEHARARLDPVGLASRFFFGAEHDAICSAAPAQRGATFLRYWVAKEAVLKAQGVGLSFPLDAFGIAFAPDGRTARVTSTDATLLDPAWTIRMASIDTHWPVAVAAAGDAWTLLACAVERGGSARRHRRSGSRS